MEKGSLETSHIFYTKSAAGLEIRRKGGWDQGSERVSKGRDIIQVR